MRSIPDETTRAAAVKTGEVDVAYLFVGPVAEDLKRSPGIRLVAPLLYGIYWLDFLDQWDPKSPWHDRRVRQAASLAIDRNGASTRRRCSASRHDRRLRAAGIRLRAAPRSARLDPKRAKQLMVEAGYPNGFDAGDLTPLPPYTSLAEAVGGYLQSIGIRTRVRTMERATFLTAWRGEKLHGLIIGATGAAGNAAARIEPFFTKSGIYAYGTRPEIDDLFRARRTRSSIASSARPLLHQIQKIIADQTMVAPIFQQAFLWGVGPRVEQPAAGLIQGYPYAAPCEDLKLKAR